MELIFVRHGRPEHVVNDDATPADPPLSEVGHAQASAMADWLADEHLDHIYVSPMRRARETAAPLERAHDLEGLVREGLSEFDRHSRAYVPMEVLKQTDRARWDAMASGRGYGRNIDMSVFRETVVDAVEAIVAERPGSRVAVVCHGGVINAYLAECLGIEGPDFLKFDVDYTSVTRVMASSAGHRSVLNLNEITHFRDAPHLRLKR